MNQPQRRIQTMMAIVLLLAACAAPPAPAATQDPELVQIEQTVDAVLTAQNDPPVAGGAPGAAATPTASALGQSADPVSFVQEAQATQTPTLDALEQTVVAMFATQNAQSTSLAKQVAQATGTAQQLTTASASSPTPDLENYPLFATPTQEPFSECRIVILRQNSRPETFRFPPRKPLLDLRRGNGIIILQPVNLRTGPTFTHRILLTLRPDPSTVPFDPSDPHPTPTVTPRPEIIYSIIGGPAYTTIGDETGDNVRFSISGRKYKWWQIELPNKTTGWIVEASACGQIQYIAKAKN